MNPYLTPLGRKLLPHGKEILLVGGIENRPKIYPSEHSQGFGQCLWKHISQGHCPRFSDIIVISQSLNWRILEYRQEDPFFDPNKGFIGAKIMSF